MRISEIFSSLIAVYNEWDFFLVNPRFIRRDLAITWDGYHPIHFNDLIFPSHIAVLYNEGQYSFQVLEDGSLFQIFYLYNDDDQLQSAKLTFLRMDVDDEKPVGWLRIDYDPLKDRGILHSKCHMHLSLFPSTRFIVKGIPTPKQFIEFIAAMCYPDLYENYHTDKQGQYTNEKRICSINNPCF